MARPIHIKLDLPLDNAGTHDEETAWDAFILQLGCLGDQVSAHTVYNTSALLTENHEAGNKFIGSVAMIKHLTAWRNTAETAWLKDAPVQLSQQMRKDLERAYQIFFEKWRKFVRFNAQQRLFPNLELSFLVPSSVVLYAPLIYREAVYVSFISSGF